MVVYTGMDQNEFIDTRLVGAALFFTR